ncbi:MAG: hypothetical protein FWD14_01030 [Treponema sp.]|nr:hypothetical protein [Treponema sp.]
MNNIMKIFLLFFVFSLISFNIYANDVNTLIDDLGPEYTANFINMARVRNINIPVGKRYTVRVGSVLDYLTLSDNENTIIGIDASRGTRRYITIAVRGFPRFGNRIEIEYKGTLTVTAPNNSEQAFYLAYFEIVNYIR